MNEIKEQLNRIEKKINNLDINNSLKIGKKKIDSLGRITIPKNARQLLEIYNEIEMEISVIPEQNIIILKKMSD